MQFDLVDLISTTKSFVEAKAVNDSFLFYI